MIVFIADIVHQALAKIPCSRAALLFRCKVSIHSAYRFQTKSAKEIRYMVAWLSGKVRFTCTTNDGEVSSKFPSCSIVVWKITLGAQVSIYSN